MAIVAYNRSVFINCPFDEDYRDLFRAIVFTVADCGFYPSCALEVDDASQVRIAKIEKLIQDSRYGIHDLSRTELDKDTKLPRFNMPLELGLFLGAKRFGNAPQRGKACLILDKEPYRYQKFISDISGQDIESHQGDHKRATTIVRNWLSAQSRRRTLPGGQQIQRRYAQFRRDLPAICADLRFDPEDQLPFSDYAYAVAYWLKG